MPIHFRCTTCNKLLSIARRKAGQAIECPVCGANIRVPEEIPHKPQPQIPSQEALPTPPTPNFPPPTSPVPNPVDTAPLEAARPEPVPAVVPPPLSPPIPPSEAPPPRVVAPTPIVKSKPPAPTPSKTQSPSSSILELDPDTFFGSSRCSIPKMTCPAPQPGILDEMYTEIPGSGSERGKAEGEETSSPEVVIEPPSRSSWKLLVFGTLLIIGLLVAAVLAWKLVFSTPS